MTCSDCTRWGQLDRIAQRQLQDADPELDLGGHSGNRRQYLQRIQGRPAAAHRITDPDAGKSARLNLPGKVRDALHQPGIGCRRGVDPDHGADAHALYPFMATTCLERGPDSAVYPRSLLQEDRQSLPIGNLRSGPELR